MRAVKSITNIIGTIEFQVRKNRKQVSGEPLSKINILALILLQLREI